MNFTYDAIEQGPIKPPPEALPKADDRIGKSVVDVGPGDERDQTGATDFLASRSSPRWPFWACSRLAVACITGRRFPSWPMSAYP